MGKPALFLAFLLGTAAPAPAAPVPAWVPIPALTARLAPPATLGRFQVQPPNGDTRDVLENGANTAYLFSSPHEKTPLLMFGLNAVPLKDCRRVLKGLKDGTPLHLHARGYTGITTSATEAGTIHGIPFKRLHWSGRGTVEGKTRGFLYLGLSGSTLFQIQADGPDQSALALAEASVLTLQPK